MKNRIIKLTAVGIMTALMGLNTVYALSDEVNEVPAEQAADISQQEAMQLLLNQHTQAYYSRAVFIGDSVMVGFKNYVKANPGCNMAQAQFLTKTSYSAWHAVRDVSKDKLQPEYNGVKQNVWTSVSMMDVDRVFMMFGTNDLIMANVNKTAENIMTVAKKIQEAKPGVEIHIISMEPVYSTTNKGGLNNATVVDLNNTLKTLCAENGYGFVDIHSSLIGADGSINPKYSSDKYVHQNYKGYAVWDGVLNDYVVQALLNHQIQQMQPTE